ncbi:four helix bundle protein [Candidatus Parcubacteria bacterium]|jgi:four helix bundle protein|nr:four helix bundle protein [Candidatus Parcubacteria bacterium]MBT3948553.1 four helix bundle protein [Candidatus Parcubacteria bacterium]
METYKDLIVWQKSINLIKEVYLLTSTFPNEEKFGLVSQMRRCSVSIASNIAEGYARKNKKENAQFVNISFGSATELETQIIISKQLEFITTNQCSKLDSLLDEVLRMLYRYRESLYR